MKSISRRKKNSHIYQDHNIKRKYLHRRNINSYTHLSVLLFPLVILILVVFSILSLHEFFEYISFQDYPFLLILKATFNTISRILIAFVFSLITAFLLAISVTQNKFSEKFFLPVFDVLESVPILAFFPIIISFFIKMNYLNGAAIFIIYITMLWSILFNIIGGIKLIPEDIKIFARVFKIRGFSYYKDIIFPAIIPELVTGSILALASAWNIVIVAEVLHVYIKNGSPDTDLLGLGSILVNSVSGENNLLFAVTLSTLITIIVFINIFIWQKLLRFAEKYKFD